MNNNFLPYQLKKNAELNSTLASQLNSQWVHISYPPAPLAGITPGTDVDHCPNNDAGINAIIQWMQQNGKTKLYCPKGWYGANHITLTKGITICGDFASSYNMWTNDGTVFKDLSPVTDSTHFITFDSGDRTSAFNGRISAGGLIGLTILGNSQKHDAIHLVKTGLDFVIRDVNTRNFAGSGLYLDDAWDMYIANFSSLYCGGTVVDGSLHYALHLADSQGNATNACKFIGNHIEECRYALCVDASKNNYFIATKIELSANALNTDVTNAPISITNTVGENSFIGCLLTTVTVEDWLAVSGTSATTASQTPYCIQGGYTPDADKNTTRFISCDFPCADNYGAKVMDSGQSRFIVNGCHFDYVTGKDLGIKLGKGSKFTNNTVVFRVASDGVVKGVNVDNAYIDGNHFNISNPNSYTITSTTGLTVWSSNSRIGDNNIFDTNFFVPVLLKVAIPIKRPAVATNITDAVFTSLWGSADKTNFPYNILNYFSKEAYFQLGSALTITSFTNGIIGDEVLIYNNGTNPITINANTNILLSASKSSLVLNQGEFSTFRMITGTVWAEFATFKH